jgi:hypothetical protein
MKIAGYETEGGQMTPYRLNSWSLEARRPSALQSSSHEIRWRARMRRLANSINAPT